MTDLILVLLNQTRIILQVWSVGVLHCAQALSLKGLLVSDSPNLSIKIFNFVNILY